MGMSSPEWSRYMHERIGLPESPEEINDGGRSQDARALPRVAAADRRRRRRRPPPRRRVHARRRVVLEPAADRGRARARRDRGALRRRRLVRGGRARQAGSGRLPRGRAPARRRARHAAPRSRTRRTGSAPRTRPGCACSRSRTRTTRPRADALALADAVVALAGRADARAQPEGRSAHSTLRAGCALRHASGTIQPCAVLLAPCANGCTTSLSWLAVGGILLLVLLDPSVEDWLAEAARARPRRGPGQRRCGGGVPTRAGAWRSRSPAGRVHSSRREGMFPCRGPGRARLAGGRPAAARVAARARGAARADGVELLTGSSEDAAFAMALPVVPGRSARSCATGASRSSRRSRRAVAEEQARIARELHDVIAHSVWVIVVQAAAADDVFDERPDQARAALRSIETAGRDALGELRRLLAVSPGGGRRARRPQPGLDRLGELAAPLRAAGLEVAVRSEGDAGRARCRRASTSPPTGSCRRRSPTRCGTPAPSRAEVTVRAGPDVLELDDPRRRPRRRGERGGRPAAGSSACASARRCSAARSTPGPRPSGGFRVHARLPLEAAP